MATKSLQLHGTSASSDQPGSIFFIGTATTLIRYRGFTILTDPNFLHRGERIHVGYGLHATRRTEPAIDFDDLPEIDLVLLSHMHEDHFDRRVAERLDRSLPIVTTPHATAVLRDKGFFAPVAMRTWDELDVSKARSTVRISAVPARHGPLVVSAALPPTMGSILDFGDFRIWVSGDTLAYRRLHEIPLRFPDIDLALVHLGGTRVLGILVTMDGEQGRKAIEIVDPKITIPIHYDDYDRFESPLDDFRRAIDRAGLGDRIHYMMRGDTYVFGRPAPAHVSGP